jgi:hypothetical protein
MGSMAKVDTSDTHARIDQGKNFFDTLYGWTYRTDDFGSRGHSNTLSRIKRTPKSTRP